MRLLKLVFSSLLFFCSSILIGQDLNFSFGAGWIILQDINNWADYKLLIRNSRYKIYDFSKGNLWHYEGKLTPYYLKSPFLLSEYHYSQLVDLRKIKKNVVPVRQGNSRCIRYNLDFNATSLFTTNIIAKKVYSFNDSVWIYSVNDTVGEYHIDSRGGTVYLSMNASKITTLRIENVSISSQSPAVPCELQETIIDSIIVSDIELKNDLIIQGTPLPKYIQLNEIVCKDERYSLDLAQFLLSDSNSLCELNVGKGVSSGVRANYKYFKLVFDSSTTMYDKERIYTELLNMQTVNYFLDGYEKLDKEYKAFKYLNRNSFVARIQNWFDKHWWDYGYDKFMVIENSILMFLLFFGINLLAYRGLTKVYHPEKFKLFDNELDSEYFGVRDPMIVKLKKKIIRIPVIFLYTAFVFWGLKLDLKELEIKKPMYMTILIGQYITGLVCLAYIANYIISK